MSAAEAVSASADPTAEQTLPLTINVPVSVAVALKGRTNGALDIAETAAMIVQLYCAAPLERMARTLSESDYARLCEALGRSPQTNAELIDAVESCVTFSLAGVRMRWNAEEVAVLMSRNAAELSPQEWAEQVFGEMKAAWIQGRI